MRAGEVLDSAGEVWVAEAGGSRFHGSCWFRITYCFSKSLDWLFSPDSRFGRTPIVHGVGVSIDVSFSIEKLIKIIGLVLHCATPQWSRRFNL